MKGIGAKRVTLPEAPFGWLLRDEFTDTRAAGAVNGTAATPGPGTRVVTDTGNNMTVSAGACQMVASNILWGDPGLWYGAFARTAGRCLIAHWNPSAVLPGGGYTIGWDNGQVGLPGVNSFNMVSAGLEIKVYNGAVIIDTGLAYALNTDYRLCVILRTAGAYWLIRGGAFTDWTLIYVGSTNNTATVYPNVQASRHTAAFGFVRIPAYLYLPTPQAYDTFTRANGPLGSSEGTGPEGQGVSARSWANQVGTTLVAGNAASASALVGGIAIATVETATANVVHGAKLTRAGNEVGVVVRYADSNNYVRAYHDGANAKLDKVVGGVVTNVITAAQAYAAGTYIWVICQGTQFDLYYNNTKIGATGTIADAALQNGTEHGLYSTNVGNSQDDMLTMPRGTEGQYNGLDKYGG